MNTTTQAAAVTIERAAIKTAGIVYSVPRPGRHRDVIQLMESKGVDMSRKRTEGFITSDGVFVGQRKASRIAIQAGQLRIKNYNPVVLFSEDIW